MRTQLLMLTAALVCSICTSFVFGQAVQSIPCSNTMCLMYCPFGFKKDVQRCDVCQCEEELCSGMKCSLGKACKVFVGKELTIARCVDPRLPERCQMPKDNGQCEAAKQRWYYDTETNACVEFSYGGCDGNANKFNTLRDCQQACAIAVPVAMEVLPGCGDQPICAMDCPFGFKHDQFGCPTCQCAESSISVECEHPLCAQYCPAGFRRDEFGCEICECATPGDKCMPTMCAMECFHGVKKDDKGCDTCECLTQPIKSSPQVTCSPIMCSMYCEFGFKKGVNGCDVCQCATAPSDGAQPKIKCPQCYMNCPYGFLPRQDGSGCSLCKCAENPCNAVECSRGQKCKLIVRGLVSEPLCVAASCSDVQCRMFCENGFAMDEKGCEKCECLRTPVPNQCPSYKCKPCSFGYARDQYGCRTCKCLPNPCKNKVCKGDDVCIVERVPECYVCAADGECREPSQVESAHVNLTLVFSSEVANPGQLERLESQLHEHLSYHLKAHNDHLKDFQINVDEVSKVEVTFIMSKKDFSNLPNRINEVRQSFESNWDQLTIDHDDTVSAVVTGIFTIVYFSDDVNSANCDIMDKHKSHKTVAVVCAAVIFVVLVVIAVAVIVYKRNKTIYSGMKPIPSISRSEYHKVTNSPSLNYRV